MTQSIFQGGDLHVELIGHEAYDLPTVVNLFNMLTSKEKRKNRRAEAAQMLENAYHKGDGRSTTQVPHLETGRTLELLQTKHGHPGTRLCRNREDPHPLHYGLFGVAEGQFDKVYYVRSDVGVEFQRGRGALPGDLSEKIAPLIAPVLDNLPCIMRSQGAAEYLLNKKIIEPVLLEDIRGRSLNEAFIIVDESQNFLPSHIKTCLSRVGKDSKICLIGDTKQTDLEVFRRENGLVDAIHRLRQLSEVGVVEFQKEDIVRNSVIAHILDRYDD